MLKSPESRPPISTEESLTQRRKKERLRLDKPFWPAAIGTLQTRDTNILRERVFSIAEAAPHIPSGLIRGFVRDLGTKYEGDTRKFTDEDEINHALQVGILTAHAIGWRTLSLETFTTALGHDLYENTPDTQEEIARRTQPDISRGIVALSHKNNGKDRYPDAEDKRPYFEAIIEAHMDDPNLEVPTIKVMDQLAVGNSPLRSDELADEEFEARWKRLSEGKLEEMVLFQQVLQERAENETFAQQKLREVIGFTKMRMEPQAGVNALAYVIFERSKKGV